MAIIDSVDISDSLNQNAEPNKLPFRFARFLSWISLLLIVISSLFLAVFIGDYARTTLINRQQDFNRAIGENLCQQIVRRFIWPTARLTGGRINLMDPVQYARLDDIVNESRYGLNVVKLRIYGGDRVINYSLDKSELGRADLIHPIIEKCMNDGNPFTEMESSIPLLEAMFMQRIPNGAFTLRMAFPLILVWPLTGGFSNTQTVGTLELIQDITTDYTMVIHLQWIIVGICSLSSAFLFILLQTFIRRSETILEEKMKITRKMATQIHENERLAGMGRVIASIAHEIRNPLGIIRSSSELLIHRVKDNDALNKKILTAVYDESCRLSQIVNDFLDYARPREVKSCCVNVITVIEQALSFLESEIKRGEVSIKRDFSETLNVSGDRDLLYRAFYNVFSNSLQAMRGGVGILSIYASPDENKTAVIIISDTGPGFPKDDIGNVLEPFFTTKDYGTGLGLPIVNTIIKGHHGNLSIFNSPGGGAVTKISLPLFVDEQNIDNVS